jgi:hypothetical protein
MSDKGISFPSASRSIPRRELAGDLIYGHSSEFVKYLVTDSDPDSLIAKPAHFKQGTAHRGF